MPDRLARKGILVTRPREMADGLAALIRAEGGRPFLLPAIDIVPPADDAPARRAFARLADYDMAIFVSPTAVRKGFALAPPWRASLPAFAVGGGTRAELARRGVAAASPEAGADSEALLALPALREVAGKRILIVRGEGGRELLADTLAARGAKVELAECYRRALPAADPGPVLDAWARGEIHAATAYSAESLRNLFALLGERGAGPLRGTPLFVPHERVAEAARRSGVTAVEVAGPSDEQVLARLVAYFDVHD